MNEPGWQFWIDRGGTFTDVIALSPGGRLVVRKLLSESPGQYEDAAVTGIVRILQECNPRADSPPRIDAIKMGTTVATNALLERRGEPTVLAITRGLGDAVRIGYQNRPDIFALKIDRPEQLYSAVVEIDERLNVHGESLQSPDRATIERELRHCYDTGYRALAVCLMHAYRSGEHERIIGEIASKLGFTQISLSHEVSALRKLVSRADTTIADAYLSPVLYRYIAGFKRGLEAAGLSTPHLLFMQSNGGLVDEASFRGKDSILSGPAGGVVGMVRASAGTVGTNLIGFDMGGTSTDVSLFADDYEVITDAEVAGVRMRAPMMRIQTIAAGGGSILKFASGRFQVGPESAGADPGPAAYRRGGPLTVTDANIMLGRILPNSFPSVFGDDGDQPLDTAVVHREFAALAQRVLDATERQMSAEQVAEGFIRVATDNMANAIKRVSIQRGFDPAEFTLCCFGGAGGQHACQVADELGIRSILIHPLAGVLSAYGIGIAPLRTYQHQTIEQPLTQTTLAELRPVVDTASTHCHEQLAAQHVPPNAIQSRTLVHLKVAGTDVALPIEWNTEAVLRSAFDNEHGKRFGFRPAGTELIIESLRVEATGEQSTATGESVTTRSEPSGHASPRDRPVQFFHRGAWQDAVVRRRDELEAGSLIAGPAIIIDDTATTVIIPGWSMTLGEENELILRRAIAADRSDHYDTDVDPVMLEVFNSHFMNVAEQMGTVLESTAHSVNIKERLDFSCALFDRDGHLIANAPHMPVHLGSMGDSVQVILRDNAQTLRPGDVYMLNTPYNGGSHLPDITVVTPVFDPSDQDILFLVACRAHHADVGGMTPGSMPPCSRSIHDEGVLFDNFRLVGDGHFREEELRAALAAKPYPARNPQQNIIDLRAQIAANEKGARELLAMIEHFGRDMVTAYMSHVQANAEECVRAAIDRLAGGSYTLTMDNGDQICVQVRIDAQRRQAEVDFAGTSPQSAGNFNAPVSVTRAAVLYVFRTLIDEPIPLNAGCLIPIRLLVPEHSLLKPAYPAAVVAGNVETSQCVTNALYGALNVLACSQGTMNNLTFGNDRYQYYETICGGSGAGATFAGTDAVQTAMTNSRITDPEVLEARYPVVVRAFSIRRGSGGRGAHRGGDGVIRRIEFLERMQAGILSNDRTAGPRGLAGGESGEPGRTYVVHPDGRRSEYGSVDEFVVDVGDVLVVETPGGGGWGRQS